MNEKTRICSKCSVEKPSGEYYFRKIETNITDNEKSFGIQDIKYLWAPLATL